MPYIIIPNSKRKITRRKRHTFKHFFNDDDEKIKIRARIKSPISEDHKFSTGPLPWISNEFLSKAYVISIRPTRYNNFRARMGPWANNVEKINGINGNNLNMNKLYESNQVSSIQIKRGKIGCFLSHRKVWKDIIDKKHQIGLILEDDINLIYCKLHEERLKKSLETLSVTTDNWDLAYLCHYPRGRTRQMRTDEKRASTEVSDRSLSDFTKTFSWHVLFGYAITLKGAEILYQYSLPIISAVDVYIGTMAKRMRIQTIRLKSPICTVKFSGSDTEGIL